MHSNQFQLKNFKKAIYDQLILYSAFYGPVTNTTSAYEYFDACLMHINPYGVIYYGAASNCLADATIAPNAGVNASYSDTKTYL